MRLLLVTTDYPPQRGGVARYYSSLVAALPTGSVDVLVPTPGRIWPHWLPWLGQIHRAGRGASTLWVGQVLPVGTVVWLLWLFGGRPYMVSTHGLDILLPLANPWRRWLVTRILRDARLVTANSRFTANKIIENYKVPRNSVSVIYPGITTLPSVSADSIESFRRQYNLSPENPIVLGVGRLVYRKGFDLLLTAMERVWQSIPTAHCVIVGDGPERESLATTAATMSRPNQVHLITHLDDNGLAAAYNCASVLVLPARADKADVEGFGIVCIEAAAMGVPVVATATGGIPEAVADGETGILITPSNIEALATALIRVLTDSNLHATLVAAGSNWASRFSWNEAARVLNDALKQTL